MQVVASSIEHAQDIQLLMFENYGKNAIVVTTNEAKPSEKIREFRNSGDEWLISVGMVSEGTNIPRLQVCCNLTNITTEMYFRQIFGRVLRKTNTPNQEAYMFMPAEPKLVSYAKRMVQDIPDEVAKVKIVKVDEEVVTDSDEDSSISDACTKNANKFTEHSGADIDILVSEVKHLLSPETSIPDNERNLTFKETINNLNKRTCQSNKPTSTPAWSVGILGKYCQEKLIVEDLEPLLISERTKTKLAELSKLAVQR